ncbi:MAG: hypothetical protein ABGX83_08965 [Nitrospira sp.]|nr:hypothetical protein [Candidatus Manganitrophaceae bacterium]HIL34061.1 hypothetical protein [Candidatus Manganitrophaceae bacterium]
MNRIFFGDFTMLPRWMKPMYALGVITVMALSGCSGDSLPGPGGTTTISGSAGDGPSVGGAITVKDGLGALVTTTPVNPVTDGTAHFSFTVSAGTVTPLIITVSGGTDIVTGAVQDFPLTTAVTTLPAGGTVTGNANPLSTLAVATATALGGGTLTPGNLAVATANVLGAMGFGFPTGVDPITTPVDTTNVAGVLRANEAAAEMIRRTSNATGSTIASTIANLANDLTTGAIDGRMAAGVTPDPQAANIAAAALAQQSTIAVETLTNNLTVTTPAGEAIPGASGANFTTVLNTSLLTIQPTAAGADADIAQIAPT